MENYLINTFRYAQRQERAALTGVATNSYSFDRWYLQHNEGSTGVNVRVWENGDSTPPASFPQSGGWYGEIRNDGVAAIGALFCQPIIATVSAALRNTKLRFSLSALASTGSPTLKMSVFEWTGTKDHASCKNLVSSWSANAPVFNSTTLTQLATSSYALNASNWADMLVSVTTGATVNNLVVAFWVEAWTNATSIYLFRPTLGRGVVTGTAAEHEELEACQQYYRKSYGIEVAPGTASSTPGLHQVSAAATGNNTIRVPVGFNAPMRTTPTVTLYDRAGNSGKLTTIAGATLTDNVTPSVGVSNASELGFNFSHADTGLNGLAAHWTASAEL